MNHLKIFPFPAIVGQTEMKLALKLNIIDPKIGGILITGDRGTGKSTTIRALIDLLPSILVIKNDPFNTDPSYAKNIKNSLKTESIKIPMIELPLGTTEDKLCGSINIQKALNENSNFFDPGLLARANRGILYIDEINLLDDHLVDILLDSAASGWNTVERENISLKHQAQFILIGSANPEEGELRPQLLDRFGMHAEVRTIKDPNLRIKIIEERIFFDQNPIFFIKKYKNEQKEMRKNILRAKTILPKVNLNKNYLAKISQVCSELDIEGVRGDLVSIRAAKALAALENRQEVSLEDIKKTITLCLRHRLRKSPLDTMNSKEKIVKIFENIFNP